MNNGPAITGKPPEIEMVLKHCIIEIAKK